MKTPSDWLRFAVFTVVIGLAMCVVRAFFDSLYPTVALGASGVLIVALAASLAVVARSPRLRLAAYGALLTEASFLILAWTTAPTFTSMAAATVAASCLLAGCRASRAELVLGGVESPAEDKELPAEPDALWDSFGVMTTDIVMPLWYGYVAVTAVVFSVNVASVITPLGALLLSPLILLGTALAAVVHLLAVSLAVLCVIRWRLPPRA